MFSDFSDFRLLNTDFCFVSNVLWRTSMYTYIVFAHHNQALAEFEVLDRVFEFLVFLSFL